MDLSLWADEKSQHNIIDQFNSKYETLWWGTQTGFPAGLPVYSRKQQQEGEKSLHQVISKLDRKVKSIPESGLQRQLFLADIKNLILGYCKDASGWGDEESGLLFFEAFIKVAEEFTGKAKEFDPQISMDDIVQAARNVWTMNSIQIMFGQTVVLTPPVFAYSMLYPYTDNCLDSPDISLPLKNEINERMKKRLQGYASEVSDNMEEKVFNLIKLIEDYYPRDIYPDVYESLYAIHQAQVKSLLLQREKTIPYETDILGISFEKGGTSVLADGFLIKGRLDKKEAGFLFGYGVLLQLVDDLRDAAIDARNGHMTLFSQLIKKWPLDKLTNRLFHFSEKVLSEGETFFEPRFKELIKQSCTFLIMEAVAQNSDFYSRDYLKKLTTVAPYRLTYLRTLKPKLKKKFNHLNNLGLGMPVSTLIRSGAACGRMRT